jgi:ferredoxin-NADP reductase
MTIVMQGDLEKPTGVHGSSGLTVTVAAKVEVADGVVALTLTALDDAPLPAWEPGAHLDLRLAGGDAAVVGGNPMRQYSLCGDPRDRSRYRVAVLREEAGRGGSRWVHDELRAGDVLQIGEPRNNFALVEADHYLFVAGGIGITPLLPMIRSVAEAGRPWRLVYGGRTRASMAFVDELAGLEGGSVELSPQDQVGLLDLQTALADTPEGTAVYSCGPEALLAAMEAACAGLPVELHVERFVARAVDPEAVDSEFEVELVRSGKLLKVDEGTSLLDALESAGADVQYSCREGTCGTCETTVLEGIPDHRDSLLTDEERAENDVMFPCVSRCLSRRLVLDL